MKNIFRKIPHILLSFMLTNLAYAVDELATIEREPAVVHLNDKAQLRQYPGGRDEQDIKVQASLPPPSKNIDGSSVGEVPVPDDHD